MHFMRGDVRDHIVSHKATTDLRIGATELCSCRDVKKINFRGIFGGVRFSTFANTIRQKRTHPSTGPLVSKKSDKAPIDNILMEATPSP
jgi:hypothetical protein